MTERSLVFNIQRYSIHDGPGIRTIVFLKGCPLRCAWCSNPEGVDFSPVLSYNKGICAKCGRCTGVCPKGALELGPAENGLRINRNLCACCGECAAICPHDALKVFGRAMSIEEILDDAAKDLAFYRRSGGGLTLSGGEPLAGGDFTFSLLKRAKEGYNLNTAVETSFCVPHEIVDKITPYIDHLLVDIKLMDPARHREAAGADNTLILDNIRREAARRHGEKTLLLRFPLIPGVNDDRENLEAMAGFITGLRGTVPLEVLPYHEFGKAKFAHLGRAYPLGDGVSPPDKEAAATVREVLRRNGVQVVHT